MVCMGIVGRMTKQAIWSKPLWKRNIPLRLDLFIHLFTHSFIHLQIIGFLSAGIDWHWSTAILWTASNWPEMHRLTAPSIQRLSIERQLSRSRLCRVADRPCSRSAVRSRCVCHKGNASTLTRAAIYLVATHTETHADVSSYPSSPARQT